MGFCPGNWTDFLPLPLQNLHDNAIQLLVVRYKAHEWTAQLQ